MKQLRHLIFRRALPCAAAENMLGLLAAIETFSNPWTSVSVSKSLEDFRRVKLSFGYG
jgi:hypothetical protein